MNDLNVESTQYIREEFLFIYEFKITSLEGLKNGDQLNV